MTRPQMNESNSASGALGRRGFLAGTAAAGLMIVKPELVVGSQANSKVRMGIIGCGGRGTWITDLFMQNGGYELVGAADYFKDRVDGLGERFKLDAAKRFTGINAYQKLIDSKPDAVVIESPPFFHPIHAMAAAEAGCHVYVAKPIAVDVPGCLTIADASRKAAEKKRCFLVDFQTRADEFYKEAVRRVHAGDIGPVVSGESVYYCGGTWAGADDLAKDPKNPEYRLRAWGLDRFLSGDIITEQNNPHARRGHLDRQRASDQGLRPPAARRGARTRAIATITSPSSSPSPTT